MSFFHQLSLIALLSLLTLNPYVETARVGSLSTHGDHRSVSHSTMRNEKLRKYGTQRPAAHTAAPKRQTAPSPASDFYSRNARTTPAASAKSAAVKPTVAKTKPASPGCKPYTEHFSTPVGAGGSQWNSLSSRHDSFKMTPGGGVELVLQPPAGTVTLSKDGTTNDKLGDGATINSTFALFYGRISFTLQASSVPGTVTAAVLIGTETDDEIDIEILGGDSTHWQTNVFHSAPGETSPLYGVFGGVEGYSGNGRVDGLHTYMVDWSPARIQWSVDGQVMRTLTPAQTLHNGQQHYPSRASRLQIGIWDASNPSGTSEWAKGPIPWSKVGHTPITAKLKSVVVECPYN